MKGFRIGLVALMLLVPVLAFAGGAQEAAEDVSDQTMDAEPVAREVVDPAIPDAWYEAPQTASELGITSFNQSPFLSGRDLPPVEERLPEDPPVIVPYDEVGSYGGEFVVWGQNLQGDFHRGVLGNEHNFASFPAAGGTERVPWLAESIEILEDGQVTRVKFREGIKWSDGTPFIPADEYSMWWEHYATATEYFDHDVRRHPTLGLQDIRIIDDYTIELVENDVSQFKSHVILRNGLEAPMGPAHVMRNYYPSVVGEEQALANAQELGFDNYIEAVETLALESLAAGDLLYEVPNMAPWVVTSRSETRAVLERNPYYPFVDTEGNQLPYVDRVVVNLAASRDIAEIQATTGGATVAWESLSSENIPLYRANEDTEDYRTLIYTSAATARPYYMFNFHVADEELREVFRNVDFRRAMSLAIDRQEINERFYFGFGNPIQATIPVTSPFYKDEYARSYAEYDPEQAGELLDSIGLTDSDGDGVRELPSGDPLEFEIMYYDAVFLQPVTLHELVAAFWSEVGVAASIESVAPGSFWQRRQTPDYEVSPHILDGAVPFLDPGFLDKGIAPVRGGGSSPVWAYGDYLVSDGEQGEEPPQIMRDLFDAAQEFRATGSEEAADFMLRSLAENLWIIGTVANPPQPVIISDSVQNVPEFMLFENALGRMNIARPAQWYITD